MYSLNMPVSKLRTKVRQEFERHRYVNKLPVVDMLLFRSDTEFQVSQIYIAALNGQMLSGPLVLQQSLLGAEG